MNGRTMDLKILTVKEAGSGDNYTKELIFGQTVGGQLTDEMIRFREIGMQKIEADHFYRGRIDEPTKSGYRPKFTMTNEISGFDGDVVEATPFNTDTGESQDKRDKSIVILALLKDVSVICQNKPLEHIAEDIENTFDMLYEIYQRKLNDEEKT